MVKSRSTFSKGRIRSYSFGFNGKEKLNEEYGEGNAYDFGDRIFDPRLGRWLSVDKLQAKFTDLSPYSYSANSPIYLVDVDGNVFIIYYKVRDQNTGKTIKLQVHFDGVNAVVQDRKGNYMGDYVPNSPNNKFSNQFVDDVLTSYNYINNDDPTHALEVLAKSTKIIEVKYLRGGRTNSLGTDEGAIISWDSRKGLEITDESKSESKHVIGRQSPAIGFWSEGAHAYLNLFDPDLAKKMENFGGSDQEEQMIHTELEANLITNLNKHSKYTLNKHGSTALNETIRADYYDTRKEYNTSSATSTVGVSTKMNSSTRKAYNQRDKTVVQKK